MPPNATRSGAHPVVFVRHDHRNRNQREGVGSAVAHFAIELSTRWRRWQQHRLDQFARRQHRLDMGRVARRTIERVDWNGPCRTVSRDGLDPRIQRRHRNRHVGAVCGDAIVAHADHGVHAIEAFQGCAAGARHALVARLRRVIEVRRTACAEADCRRSWPCCEAASTRPPESPATTPDSGGAPACRRRRRYS